VGVAWSKTSKKGNDFLSVAAVGGREKDQYELILRHKETQAELDLFNTESCSMVVLPNQFKTDKAEDAKKPDFSIKVFLKD
jgi:hypothetical protein